MSKNNNHEALIDLFVNLPTRSFESTVPKMRNPGILDRKELFFQLRVEEIFLKNIKIFFQFAFVFLLEHIEEILFCKIQDLGKKSLSHCV